MTPVQLAHILATSGYTVTPDGGNLIIKGPRPLGPVLMAEVRRAKQPLIRLYTPQPAPPLPEKVTAGFGPVDEYFQVERWCIVHEGELPPSGFFDWNQCHEPVEEKPFVPFAAKPRPKKERQLRLREDIVVDEFLLYVNASGEITKIVEET